ncbi:hypothetical protein [Yoonia sp.]|uniref:hypothetical protein n=1 Tax=Yoonia sp. TaxID=2212373 RepID=UPI002FD9BFDC
MFNPDQDGVYARVAASKGRAVFSYGVLFGLGLLVLYTTVIQPPALGWMIFMLGFGVLMLWMAEKQRRASKLEILLTADEVIDSEGRVLARVDDILRVSRGALAFKPSNGFTIVTRTPGPRVYIPGMWWRIGARVGVGGITGAGQTKFMAEQIALRINSDGR